MERCLSMKRGSDEDAMIKHGLDWFENPDNLVVGTRVQTRTVGGPDKYRYVVEKVWQDGLESDIIVAKDNGYAKIVWLGDVPQGSILSYGEAPL